MKCKWAVPSYPVTLYQIMPVFSRPKQSLLWHFENRVFWLLRNVSIYLPGITALFPRWLLFLSLPLWELQSCKERGLLRRYEYMSRALCLTYFRFRLSFRQDKLSRPSYEYSPVCNFVRAYTDVPTTGQPFQNAWIFSSEWLVLTFVDCYRRGTN
jgi:hypothetical protein